MYLVTSTTYSEMVKEITDTDETTIMFDSNRVVPFVLVWMKDKGKYPIVRYKPNSKDFTGVDLNSYVNIMNCDYRGKMDLWVYINSTNYNERKRILGEKWLESLPRIAEIFQKCPKAKNKITLIFSSGARKLEAPKIANVFSPSKFNIRVMETKNKSVEKVEASFEKLGYEICY